MTIKFDWKKAAEIKKKEVDSNIPNEWILPSEILEKYDETTPESVLDVPKQFLNPKEFEITEFYTAIQLLEKLKNGEFTAIEIVKAFSHRAAIATQLTNCCTELMFDYGEKRATFLDTYLKTNGKPYGPLHGLPISLKDSFNIPGYDSTLGYTSEIGNKPKNKSDLVRELEDLGAVFYVKTNIPQTLMTADSENNIFGRTLNPNNLTLTAGGSSGGEGALIKMRGSILGIGTDAAGSIRIPALCNGVYGFRPSSRRYAHGNQMHLERDAYIDIETVAGPLSTDFETIEFLTKIIYNDESWRYDPDNFRICYQEPKIKQSDKISIGIIIEDPALPVHPPLQRILREVAKKLSSNGHQIEFIENFPSYEKSWEVAWSSFATDEPVSYQNLVSTGERIIKSLLLPCDVYGSGPKDIDEVIKLKAEINKMHKDWLSIYDKYDVIVSPGAPGTAPPHDTYGIAPYTTLMNVLDFPSVIIPYGKIEKDVDIDVDVEYPKILDDIYAHYSLNLYKGAPGHIQVSAPRLEDEKLLACCSIIDKVLKQ